MSQSQVSNALPVTPKQIAFAKALAQKNRTFLPWEVQQNRSSLSAWIDQQAKAEPSNIPSSKQVAFAERIARAKRIAVPDEAFRDRDLMTRWITTNMF